MPTPEGGTHEAGFWAAILKGIKAYGELVGNKKAAQITREDLTTGAGALVSCFIREPEFVGQTKDRLATVEAQRMVENSVRDHFDNWLAADTKSAGAILDFSGAPRRRAPAPPPEKETSRKSATQKLRLPGKLTDCSAKTREGTELFIVEGDSAGGSAKMARDRATKPCCPCAAKSSTCWARPPPRSDQSEIADLCQALGVGLGTKFNVDDLRYDKSHHHDRCGCRRRPYRRAADDLLLHPDAPDDRPRPPLPRLPAALPPHPRRAPRFYVADDAEKDALMEKGLGGKGKIDVQRFKGLGEMDAKDLKETTMDPKSRKLIRVTIDEDEPGQTGDLVERLMGKKPELRFQYIQENARFVEELDV